MPCNRAVHPAIWSQCLDSVQTTGDKVACLHDATSAFDHVDNLDGQSDKQGNIFELTALPSMEDLLIRKNLRWTGYLMRLSPDRLPKQIVYSQLLLVTEREGALVSGSRIPSRET